MLTDSSNIRALASRFAVAAVVGGAMCVGAGPAFAYRPFDGTDAAVAEPGQVEVELQPAGRLQELPCRRQLGGHHLAALGLGDGALQRANPIQPRAACRSVRERNC
jgi:hypothetical protein